MACFSPTTITTATVTDAKRLFTAIFGGGSNASSHDNAATPAILKKGSPPKLKTSAAGPVRVTLRGFVMTDGRLPY